MSDSGGAAGHFVDAVVLAAEAGEHLWSAQFHLAVAAEAGLHGVHSHLAGSIAGSVGAGSISSALHQDGDTMYHGVAVETHQAAQEAGAAWTALTGAPGPSDPPPNPS